MNASRQSLEDLPRSPEDVILGFSEPQLRQLLSELGLESSQSKARKLQRMVRALGSFEQALASIAGPPRMRRAG